MCTHELRLDEFVEIVHPGHIRRAVADNEIGVPLCVALAEEPEHIVHSRLRSDVAGDDAHTLDRSHFLQIDSDNTHL